MLDGQPRILVNLISLYGSAEETPSSSSAPGPSPRSNIDNADSQSNALSGRRMKQNVKSEFSKSTRLHDPSVVPSEHMRELPHLIQDTYDQSYEAQSSRLAHAGVVKAESDRIAGPEADDWKCRLKPEEWLAHVTEHLRHNPHIDLMPLDMSCSFSVSDAKASDMPLVYCSPAFERLTRYSRAHVKGLNHRFMQDPRGRQARGARRRYTDNAVVAEMFQKLCIGKESQVVVRNYKRSASVDSPWSNYLTMIPISIKLNCDVDFIFALQLDCGLYPQNIHGSWHSDAVRIDYRTPYHIERNFLRSTGSAKQAPEPHVPIDLLLTSGEAKSRDWSHFLLQNIDDPIFVFSLKGIILSVSDAVHSLLGYEAETIVGKSCSYLTHPQDIVSMLRDFRDVEIGAPINILARVLHKDERYRWIEFAGRAHLEDSSRGARHIVLSARLRTLTDTRALNSSDIGGLWFRISFDGMILFTTTEASTVLKIPTRQLIGMNFSEILQEDDARSFRTMLQTAGTMTRSISFSHIYMSKYGDYEPGLSLVSELYPGSEDSDQKSYLIITKIEGDRPPWLVQTLGPEDPPDSDLTAPSFGSKLDEDILSPIAPRNILDDLNVTKNTSWQFELHQTRILNRKLRNTLRAKRYLNRRG